MQSDEQVHPAEDALFNFQPDKNRIDKVLYDGIVDENALVSRPTTFHPRVSNEPGSATAAGFDEPNDEFKELLIEEADASDEHS